MTDVISMRQIPNYIYMVVKPQYNAQKPQFSNHLCFPITNLNITFYIDQCKEWPKNSQKSICQPKGLFCACRNQYFTLMLAREDEYGYEPGA